MNKEKEEIVFSAKDNNEYLTELHKFKQKHSSLPITFRSTIKPIKFPTKVTMTKRVGSYECWFDY